jgi:predicted porin
MFKKLVIAGAMATAVAGSALAQSSVTIYGMIDMGVIGTNHAGTANANVNALTSGVDQTSRLGFRSVEDLGGGRSAGMNLESQIDAGNGSQGLTSGGGVANGTFARAANVFLEDKKFGRLTMGRQANVAWSTYASLDGRKNSNFGSITDFIADGSSFGGTATSKSGLSNYTGGAFTSNTVRYDTPTFKGFNATYGRVFGNVSGDADAGSSDQYMIRYDNKGMFYGAVGMYKANNSVGNASGENVFVGAGARVTKSVTLTSSYFQLKNPGNSGGANGSFDLYSVGARYQATPKIELTTGIYQLKDNNNSNNGADVQSLLATYSLSKRTHLYAGGSFVQNKGATGIAAYGAGGANLNSLGTTNALAQAGVAQSAYAIGMRHTF